MKESILQTKSKLFARRIIKLYSFLQNEKQEYIISKQVLRSGTSIGANIAEAYFAQSKKDFINKMAIALKEVSETHYWLDLLIDENFIAKEQSKTLKEECLALLKMLQSTINTTKKNIK